MENTALAGWCEEVVDGQRRRRMVCSQCNPDLGVWHGAFPREDASGYNPDLDYPYYLR